MKTELYGSIDDARYAGYVDDIQQSGHHLRDVINDILDLSTVQAKMPPCRSSPSMSPR